jgi:hypothetical protein
LSGWCVWDNPTIENITINSGDKVVVSLHVSASAGAWGTIDDFELCKTGDVEETKPSKPTPSKPQSSDTVNSDTDSADSQEDSDSNNDTSSLASENAVAEQETTGIVEPIVIEAADSTVEGVVYNPNQAILKQEIISQFYNDDKPLLVHLGNGIGISIAAEGVNDNLVDVDLSASLGEVKNFAPQFDTFRMKPKHESKLPYSAGINMNLGLQYKDRFVYVFVKNMTTGQYEFKYVTTVNEIGNIGVITDEFTEIMALIAK